MPLIFTLVIVQNYIYIIYIYGAIDDLYQESARFSKLKLFFSIRSIRLSMVYSALACMQEHDIRAPPLFVF